MNDASRHDSSDRSALRRRWEEVDPLFDRILAHPPDEREEALERVCPDDPELRHLVRSLLHTAASTPEDPTGPDPRLLAAALDRRVGVGEPVLRPGDTVGRYRIVGELGSGGMAIVYEAERSDGAYEQVVALKVLRRGLDTDRIIERFLAERQILSDFAHPHVARLLDGGTTADGRPFLVMERVEGEPITWKMIFTWKTSARFETESQPNTDLEVDAVVSRRSMGDGPPSRRSWEANGSTTRRPRC